MLSLLMSLFVSGIFTSLIEQVSFDDLLSKLGSVEAAPQPSSSVEIRQFLQDIGLVPLSSRPESIGLEEFADKFVAEDVTFDVLLACNDSDFKDLGVNLGKKKKIQAGFARFLQ